jgi:SAM-dependent methyltransferase
MISRITFYHIYWFLKKLIIPGLRYSHDLYEDVIRCLTGPEKNCLDLGCGANLLPPWRHQQELELARSFKTIVGIDYDFSSLIRNKILPDKVRGDVLHLPFRKETFDVVVANMVVEHLKEPAAVFSEIHRVLKPNGIFSFHTPNRLSYLTLVSKLVPHSIRHIMARLIEGRKMEDVFYTYYRANTTKEIEFLAHQSGYKVRSISMVATDAEFAVIPPLALIELVIIRILMLKKLRPLRTNIITVLEKTD